MGAQSRRAEATWTLGVCTLLPHPHGRTLKPPLTLDFAHEAPHSSLAVPDEVPPPLPPRRAQRRASGREVGRAPLDPGAPEVPFVIDEESRTRGRWPTGSEGPARRPGEKNKPIKYRSPTPLPTVSSLALTSTPAPRRQFPQRAPPPRPLQSRAAFISP